MCTWIIRVPTVSWIRLDAGAIEHLCITVLLLQKKFSSPLKLSHRVVMACMGALSSGLVWLCLCTIFLSLPLALSDDHENDRQALLCFKSQLSGPTGVLASWNNASMEFCNWHGINCSTQSPRRVTKIVLASEGISGSISPCVANLTSLTRLQLSNNSFYGSIPSELGLLRQLNNLNLSMNSLEEVNLSKNKLEGRIPSAFGSLSKLKIIILSSNRLTGDIPASSGNSLSLKYVDLSSNVLTGSIPESLVNSSSLRVLVLTSNTLSGEIPKALFNSSSLIAVYLDENNFAGSIPLVAASSLPLQYLYLGGNKLSGKIPSSLGNLSSLLDLSLTRNNLIGSIPDSLGHITTLYLLNLNVNNLTGNVPSSIFNLSSLTIVAMINNSLTGELPSNIGYTLPNIETLTLSGNRFKGSIPPTLVNASHLRVLQLSNNSLHGLVPLFGSLPNLENLILSYNNLEADNWSFISSLSNCSKLTKLLIEGSNLKEIGNLKSLEMFEIDYNLLTGNIPPAIGNLQNLVILSLAHNKLSGQIPNTIGNLVKLTDLKLDRNNFSGGIPAALEHCTQLNVLNLAYNSLTGRIPNRIFKISSLSQEFDLSHNYLFGGIPDEVGNLINLKKLSISNNRLSGNISSNLGQCVVLESLQIQSNLFVGSIPKSFESLVGIQKMDISQNNLSGKIPEFLGNFSLLYDLNLSFNNFDGEVPASVIFRNASVISMEGNNGLCARTSIEGIPLCSTQVHRKRKLKSMGLILVIVIPTISVAIISLSFVVFLRKRIQVKPTLPQFNEHRLKNIAYEDIAKATNMFSSDNLIGSGSFSMVYKGNLQLRKDEVAIKIFSLGAYGAHKSFIAECETLRNVRHRNLVKVITLCCSVDANGADFKALVFPYMQNGNLDTWLHPKCHKLSRRNILSISQRVSIALDVAFALDYLHNQCATPLIHCDLKPSNILLDLDMVAYVSDFGLARFVYSRLTAEEGTSTSLTCLKGSIGYIPPEYGMGKDISTKGDVYSFGILLLEIMTGSRPTDEKYNSSTTLHEFVDAAFPDNIYEVLDPAMLQNELVAIDMMEKCIISLVKIGLSCSVPLPKERPEMGQVASMILEIKHAASNMHVRSS
uniref:Receptor kinase-like protein Xa21 n=1 Tax=Leersia perrieri TaxID=77586 RepID=A0A0D9WRL6_9ORYZ